MAACAIIIACLRGLHPNGARVTAGLSWSGAGLTRVVESMPVQMDDHRVAADDDLATGIEHTGREDVLATIHITHGNPE